jgi:hypothetical protein
MAGVGTDLTWWLVLVSRTLRLGLQPEDEVSFCYEPATWQELQRLKEVYDPNGVFRPLAWKHHTSWLA